jgi:prepilin-type N-terminal cleavage/methylation domain-containing protein
MMADKLKKILCNRKGFTLVELLAVLIIIAILAAVAVPTYMSYVKGARAANAQTTIGAVVTANKVYMQKFGKYATSIEQLEKEKLLEVEPAARRDWSFTVVAGGQNFNSVNAVSTDNMPAGAGKTITYNVEEGSFKGYGIDE